MKSYPGNRVSVCQAKIKVRNNLFHLSIMHAHMNVKVYIKNNKYCKRYGIHKILLWYICIGINCSYIGTTIGTYMMRLRQEDTGKTSFIVDFAPFCQSFYLLSNIYICIMQFRTYPRRVISIRKGQWLFVVGILVAFMFRFRKSLLVVIDWL